MQTFSSYQKPICGDHFDIFIFDSDDFVFAMCDDDSSNDIVDFVGCLYQIADLSVVGLPVDGIRNLDQCSGIGM